MQKKCSSCRENKADLSMVCFWSRILFPKLSVSDQKTVHALVTTDVGYGNFSYFLNWNPVHPQTLEAAEPRTQNLITKTVPFGP